MILKDLTHDYGKSDCWNYYDKIDSASVYYDEAAHCTCITVHFEDRDVMVSIEIIEEAYLLNDGGQVLEHISNEKPSLHDDIKSYSILKAKSDNCPGTIA